MIIRRERPVAREKVCPQPPNGQAAAPKSNILTACFGMNAGTIRRDKGCTSIFPGAKCEKAKTDKGENQGWQADRKATLRSLCRVAAIAQDNPGHPVEKALTR
jgi:hypothetical protein